MSEEKGFGVEDVRALAERAVDTFLHLVRRGMALAGGVLIIAAFCCVGGFLLGYAALSDGVRTLWVVLGGFFMIVGIGAVIVAMWRLSRIRRAADSLVDEVTRWITGDQQAERVVIETIETSEEVDGENAVVLSRQFFDMQSSIGPRRAQFTEITTALRSITSFPALIAVATLVSFVFAGLGLLFLIALAL